MPIEAVHVTGNVRVSAAAILRALRSQPGTAFHLHTLQADMQTVYGLANFEGVGPFDVQKTARGGVIITLPVQENPHPFADPALSAFPG